MKKTEKIEIRVSPEDKAALMRLSHQGGRSVSETVRGLLLNQAAPDPASTPGHAMTNMPMTNIQKLAYGAGGVVLGAVIASGLFMGLAPAKPHPTDYALHVVVLEGSETERHAYEASTVLTLDEAKKAQLRMPAGAADAYQVNVDMKRQADGSVYATFSLCREAAGVCTEVAKPSLLAARDAAASLNMEDAGGRALMINMGPVGSAA